MRVLQEGHKLAVLYRRHGYRELDPNEGTASRFALVVHKTGGTVTGNSTRMRVLQDVIRRLKRRLYGGYREFDPNEGTASRVRVALLLSRCHKLQGIRPE